MESEEQANELSPAKKEPLKVSEPESPPSVAAAPEAPRPTYTREYPTLGYE